MSEPAGGTADPFDAQPREPAAFRGCSRPVLIGCGVGVLGLGLLFLLLIVKADDLFRWAFAQSENAIVELLPPDVTEDEVQRLRRAFDAVGEAVTAGRIDTRGLQELQSALSEAGGKGDRLTREDVRRLTEALERVAGAGGEESGGSRRAPPPPPSA